MGTLNFAPACTTPTLIPFWRNAYEWARAGATRIHMFVDSQHSVHPRARGSYFFLLQQENSKVVPSTDF